MEPTCSEYSDRRGRAIRSSSTASGSRRGASRRAHPTCRSTPPIRCPPGDVVRPRVRRRAPGLIGQPALEDPWPWASRPSAEHVLVGPYPRLRTANANQRRRDRGHRNAQHLAEAQRRGGLRAHGALGTRERREALAPVDDANEGPRHLQGGAQIVSGVFVLTPARPRPPFEGRRGRARAPHPVEVHAYSTGSRLFTAIRSWPSTVNVVARRPARCGRSTRTLSHARMSSNTGGGSSGSIPFSREGISARPSSTRASKRRRNARAHRRGKVNSSPVAFALRENLRGSTDRPAGGSFSAATTLRFASKARGSAWASSRSRGRHPRRSLTR